MHPIVEFLTEIDRNPGQSPGPLLDNVLRQCRKHTSAEAGTIFLARSGDGGDLLQPMSLQNDAVKLEAAQIVVPIDEASISGYVAATGESLLIDDAYDIPDNLPYGFNTAYDAATGYRTKSVACIPLRRHDGEVGAVVQLLNRRGAQGEILPFEAEQAEFIAAAGVVMTGVIDRAEMLERQAHTNRELKKQNDEIEALQMETEAALLEAEKSNRAKSEFLNCIGHELKTPLNAVIGFSELLRNEGFGPLGHPSYKEFANDISDSGTKLLGIVEDILAIIQAEAQSIACSDGGPAAYGCIEDTCRAMFDEAVEQNIVFALEISDDPSDCVICTESLRKILDRLIDNAIRFTEAGGEIDVYAGPISGGGLEIRISDTGIGMTQTDIIKALAPFGQADTSLARGYEGAGLGLTLASALTRSMKGEFSIESEPGTGTTIEITFPETGNNAASRSSAAMVAAPATAMWVSG
ncbi:MAG: ATP-binding protein [Alphaproteobacteria bacterium]